MNELIRIEINTNNEQIVSARDLHGSLGVNKDFTDWFKQQTERIDLTEGKDFTPSWGKSTGGRPGKDFIVSLDIAKHLCMISGGDKAREVREYFISVEKQWNSPEQVMARGLQYANMQMIKYQTQVIELASKMDLLTHSKKLYTTTEIAKELGYRSAQLLNEELENKKIQYKINSTWVLSARFAEKGFVSIKQEILDSGRIIYDRKWTEAGRQYLLEKFGKKHGELQ